MIRIIILMSICASLVLSANAQASPVTGFIFNTSSVDGDFTTPVSNVGSFSFEAVERVLGSSPTANPVAPGSQIFMQGYGRITGFAGAVNTGNLNGGSALGRPYELTFLYTNGGFFTGLIPGSTSFYNKAAGVGSLGFYFDDLADGMGQQGDLGTGVGFGDGENFANAINTDFGGGSFSLNNGIGVDTTEYLFAFLLDNVFQTSSGQDFTPDSNYSFVIDSDFNPVGPFPLPGQNDPVWDNLFAPTPGFNPLGVVYKSGTIDYQVVPLPGAVWLLLAGLGGLGALRRR